MAFNDPKELIDPQAFNDPKGITIESLDFDNTKVQGDTSIFDGLVFLLQLNLTYTYETDFTLGLSKKYHF